MFTGIIETPGEVIGVEREGTNLQFRIRTNLAAELKVDQSVSHNGVCLTVVTLGDDWHEVTAIEETLKKSNLGRLKVGDIVNIERCMPAYGRFDGHIVQGHVDGQAICVGKEDKNGSWLFHFEHEDKPGHITVEKGSVTVNGVSLTCFNSSPGRFSVAIIPYTYAHTNFKNLEKGSTVNLEFDVIGKYVQRILSAQG